jgi:hypothetical protein
MNHDAPDTVLADELVEVGVLAELALEVLVEPLVVVPLEVLVEPDVVELAEDWGLVTAAVAIDVPPGAAAALSAASAPVVARLEAPIRVVRRRTRRRARSRRAMDAAAAGERVGAGGLVMKTA